MQSQSNTGLLAIQIEGETLTVDSVDFANGLGVQHKNLLESIRTHIQSIESAFGKVAFKTRPIETEKGVQKTTYAELTEDQALFIGTLSRNSSRVVEFKAVLVKSFAEARKSLLTSISPAVTTDTAIVQLLAQQTQVLAETQRVLVQLRADVDSIMIGQRPARNLPTLKPLPIGSPMSRTAKGSPLRQHVNHLINEYCGYHNVEPSETYNYLYKRLYDVYGVNVYRLIRAKGEVYLDAVERYGHLDRLLSLITAELHYSE